MCCSLPVPFQIPGYALTMLAPNVKGNPDLVGFSFSRRRPIQTELAQGSVVLWRTGASPCTTHEYQQAWSDYRREDLGSLVGMVVLRARSSVATPPMVSDGAGTGGNV